jgi:AraC-like DNA-binding protein
MIETPLPESRLDVGQLPPDKRLGAWTGALYDCYYPLDLQCPTNDFTAGRLDLLDVDNVRVGFIDSDPMIVHRRREHLNKRPGDYYFVPIPMSQPVRISQRSNDVCVKPKSFGLIATAESYTYEQRTENQLLTLRISGSVMRERLPGIDDFAGECREPHQATVALFVDLVQSVARNGHALAAGSSNMVAQQLLDLLVLAVTTDSAVESGNDSAVRSAHRRRINRVIEMRLQDTDLGLASIAQELQMSKRYIQKILSDNCETVSSLLHARRVAHAKRYLADPTRRHQSIAQIGFSVGYSDPSHFSRIFRRETGFSPRDFRQRSLDHPARQNLALLISS